MSTDELKSQLESFRRDTNGHINGDALEVTWPTPSIAGGVGYIQALPHAGGCELQFGVKNEDGKKLNGGILFVPQTADVARRLVLIKGEIESGRATVKPNRSYTLSRPDLEVAAGFKIR
jgi:hypothetical protein